MTQFRKGDVVMLKATVDSEYEIDGNVRVRIGYSDMYAEVKDLKMLRPVIKVGDNVIHERGDVGTVLAIVNDWCWVKSDVSRYETWHVSVIQRLDQEPVEPELFEPIPVPHDLPAPDEAA